MKPKIDLIGIGKRLRNLRKKKNETQKDLASIISSTPDSISKIERGEMILTLDNMILISEHYNVSLDYLCKGEGGSTLLDTLNKYFTLSYHKVDTLKNNDTSIYPLPMLSINRAYFDYLLQTANANIADNLPDELRKQWIDLETKKLTENILHDTYRGYASFVPVNVSLV